MESRGRQLHVALVQFLLLHAQAFCNACIKYIFRYNFSKIKKSYIRSTPLRKVNLLPEERVPQSVVQHWQWVRTDTLQLLHVLNSEWGVQKTPYCCPSYPEWMCHTSVNIVGATYVHLRIDNKFECLCTSQYNLCSYVRTWSLPWA